MSDTELEVMKVLWEHGDGSVRMILEKLAEAGRKWAYTTVQTLLNRLQAKGFVHAEKSGRAYIFRVSVTRDQHIGEELDDLAARICEGSATPLMLTLVQNRSYSAAELQEFRELLDRLESRPTRTRKKAKKKKKKRSRG